MSTTTDVRSTPQPSSLATSAAFKTFAVVVAIITPVIYVLCEMQNWPLFTYHPGTDRVEWLYAPAVRDQGPAMYWYGWIGTTLINGNWFTRHLLGVGRRAIVMHGHRHIDWMGQCGDLLILSAASSTMAAKGQSDVYFYVHTVGVDASGNIGLAQPERVDVVAV